MSPIRDVPCRQRPARDARARCLSATCRPAVARVRPRTWLLVAALAAALAPRAARAGDPAAGGSYRLPFEDGTTRRCTQSNGGDTSHTGNAQWAFDFSMPESTPVCAARDGRVITAKGGETRNGDSGKHGPRGNHIEIDHGDGTRGVYMHLHADGVLVEVGDWVMQGEVIGKSGNTGRSTGPHLHFAVHRGAASIPIAFADVAENEGVPVSGKSYTSRNTPGIPAAAKDRLDALLRAAETARAQGVFALAYASYERVADARLPVAYPPQERAREAMAEIDRAGEALTARAREAFAQDAVAFEAAVGALIRAQPRYDGTATERPMREALAAARRDPRYAAVHAAARRDLAQQDRFDRALRYELQGKLDKACRQYRSAVAAGEDTPLGARARERLGALEARMREAAGATKG